MRSVNRGAAREGGGTLAVLWAVGKGALSVALVVMLCALMGCVETADCDASTACDDAEANVCYNYRCVPRCGEGGRCADGLICVPCGTVRPCPGDPQANACVEVP
jgi:hypothetical protein